MFNLIINDKIPYFSGFPSFLLDRIRRKHIFIYTQVYLHTFYLKIQYTHISLGNYISGRIKPFFNSRFISYDELAALYETAVPFYELNSRLLK